ncbi:pneumococcal serine-rich repeat protein [Labrus bergylta]|uniref:pneumococcal serine-rich repeat protein n=1 Tax=Labrus bergylta TaxID=56723 RepID=UPI0033135653
MKPDGVNMETTEPTEAAAVAEHPPLQDITTEQAPSQPGETANDVAPEPAPKANGKAVAADPKAKTKAVSAKIPPTAKSAGATRPVTASQRTVNDVKSSNNVSAAAKKATTSTSAKVSATGPASKRPVGVAAVSSTLKNQTKVPDRKPVGAARTTSAAATATNGTKPTTANGTPKRRPVAETVRPKTTASSNRPASSTAPKPSTSTTTTRPAAGATAKTTRPATAPPTSRLASTTTSRPTSSVTSKPSTTAAAKTTASRATTVPSTGRTTTAQLPKTAAAAKKDVSRPPPAAMAKKPLTTTSSATKKPESSKPATTTTVKQNSASKLSTTAKAAETKVSQTKAQPPAKSAPAKKPAAAARLPALNRPPIGRTPPASPVNKPANSSAALSKRGAKPTQAVPPFTAAKKTGVSNTTTPAVETQHADNATVATVAAATAAIVLAESQSETAESPPQESSLVAPALEEVSLPVLAQDTTPDVEPEETVQSHAAASAPPESLVLTQTTSPQEQPESNAPLQTTQEQIPAPADPEVPPVASSSDLQKESVNPFTDQTPSISQAPPVTESPLTQLPPQSNLNDEEDEEEQWESQQVSVSEMSGTTQPTEESRPGSAGLVRGSAWRASGALLSELDSEEVSGSQQGASELSAPGVLEGTESMDDLGDGSLKGAIDMEGASAGSPDFEKVPDIPVNDFDEDEEDDEDDDRVCDMDVGSERADEPQRPRHDNDVDEEEDDEDVEMASEGVTESGLESYGNADEDDFAEDERLDNLNRVAEPPPPPLLPSAPAAQWDQPNPFADHWAEPLQPQQVLENVSQAAGAAAASPLADPWQADSETPTQTPAQAWLELSSGPFGSEEAPHQSSVKDEAENLEARLYMDQSSPAPLLTLPSAAGMSLSSTLSSETSTPEELADPVRLRPQDAQVAGLSPQPDQDYQEEGDQEEEEEAEAETLPADEVLGGPATAPTSNPSSSSVTEDEASDTEGEAQLEDSLETPAVANIIFDSQAATRRCLSVVEEGEEAEVSACAVEDITPPSATSLASYGFDTTTTASNSNAQSTGESCVKSPGIFSLEELPEEVKEPFLIPQPAAAPSLAEHQYIECGKQEAESAEHVREEEEEALDPSSTPITMQQTEENPEDIQPPYYSAICEKTENSYAGFTALPHPHRRDHAAYPRTYCDIIKPPAAAAPPPKLTCADLPPRSLGRQALSPQLRRLEQHQKQLLEMQHRREQQSRPLEEAEQERKTREEEEQRKKKEEAEEEIKRNKEERKVQEQAEAAKKKKEEEEEEEEEKVRKEEELKQRRDLELQLQQQQEELKQRQQIMQWQQELQESNKGQTVVLSPSSGLCTIYEALENTDEEEGEDEGIKELKHTKKKKQSKQETENKTEKDDACEKVKKDEEKHEDSAVSTEDPPPPPPLSPDSPQTPSNDSQDGDSPLSLPPESPERPPPLDLDWGKKVDIVQQLINQTLMLNRDGCSSLLLLPGRAGGTLSPLESSLWPSLLPPLTPPSATVTSVSSFSPEATGSSPQGEWTVVELETHH